TVTADAANENDASVTFRFELSNAPQAGHPATLTVDVGGVEHTVTIGADGKGVLTLDNPNGPDVYVDPSDLTATVTAINGGNFEATNVDGASATVTIGDVNDTTSLTVTADAAN